MRRLLNALSMQQIPVLDKFFSWETNKNTLTLLLDK